MRFEELVHGRVDCIVVISLLYYRAGNTSEIRPETSTRESRAAVKIFKIREGLTKNRARDRKRGVKNYKTSSDDEGRNFVKENQ